MPSKWIKVKTIINWNKEKNCRVQIYDDCKKKIRTWNEYKYVYWHQNIIIIQLNVDGKKNKYFEATYCCDCIFIFIIPIRSLKNSNLRIEWCYSDKHDRNYVQRLKMTYVKRFKCDIKYSTLYASNNIQWSMTFTIWFFPLHNKCLFFLVYFFQYVMWCESHNFIPFKYRLQRRKKKRFVNDMKYMWMHFEWVSFQISWHFNLFKKVSTIATREKRAKHVQHTTWKHSEAKKKSKN